MLWLFLQNAGCFLARTTYGSRTQTRDPWTSQVNTPGSSYDDRKLEGISSQSLEKPCWQIQQGTLLTFSGLHPGIWPGQSMPTQRWPYRRPEPHLFHQTKSRSDNGVHYIIQPGFHSFGLYSEQCSSPPFWIRWISKAYMEQGGPQFSMLPPVCLGKTGRAWKFKQSLLRRRRSRRRHRQAALNLSRKTFFNILYLHVLHLAGLDMCPGFSHRTCALLKIVARKTVQICDMAQQQHRHRVDSPCPDMSESDEDAPWRIGPRPPPESGPRPPAGPPPPRTLQSWMGLSHAYSQAVAGFLNTHYASRFRGSILTYLPPELQTPYVGLRDIVVSIRPLRPHERDHPLTLHIQGRRGRS